jgi:hypothetical protein
MTGLILMEEGLLFLNFKIGCRSGDDVAGADGTRRWRVWRKFGAKGWGRYPRHYSCPLHQIAESFSVPWAR